MLRAIQKILFDLNSSQMDGICNQDEPANKRPDTDNNIKTCTPTQWFDDEHDSQGDFEDTQQHTGQSKPPMDFASMETTKGMQDAGQQDDHPQEGEQDIFPDPGIGQTARQGC